MEKHTKKTPSLFRYPVLVAFGLFFIGLFVLPTTYAVESTSSTSTAATRVTVCLRRAFQSFSMSGVQHRMLTASSTP